MDYKSTIKRRLALDPAFRKALIYEALQLYYKNDISEVATILWLIKNA